MEPQSRERRIPMSENNFPGVPRIESPVFALDAQSDLTEAERIIARDLNTRGYAALDFLDPDIKNLIERIKGRLRLRFDVPVDDPVVDKTKGIRGVQDA